MIGGVKMDSTTISSYVDILTAIFPIVFSISFIRDLRSMDKENWSLVRNDMERRMVYLIIFCAIVSIKAILFLLFGIEFK